MSTKVSRISKALNTYATWPMALQQIPEHVPPLMDGTAIAAIIAIWLTVILIGSVAARWRDAS